MVSPRVGSGGSVGPTEKPESKKKGKGIGREFSREGTEQEKVEEVEQKVLSESDAIQPQKRSPLSLDIKRLRATESPLPGQIFSPGPFGPFSPGPAQPSSRISTSASLSPSEDRPPSSSPAPESGLSSSYSIKERELSEDEPPAVVAPTVSNGTSKHTMNGAPLIRTKLTDLQVPDEIIEAIVASWPQQWLRWAESTTVEGREVYQQLHSLKGVKVHRDADSDQMVIDIALPVTARGRHRQGKSMVRLMEDGRVMMMFRFKGPKTPEECEAMEAQFQAILQLKEAWVASGKRPEDDPLLPHLIEGKKEITHVGKGGEVVTRYIFEKADGDLRQLIRDEEEEPLPEGILEQNRPTALKICLGTAQALAAVHKRGFVHKDVQPKNILRIGDRAILSDFDTLARSGKEFSLGGTIAYLPPECFRDPPPETNDPSLDMFAFGVMLAEVLDSDIGNSLHEICVLSVPADRAEEPPSAEGAPPEEERGFVPTKFRLLFFQSDMKEMPAPWPLVARLIDPEPKNRPTAQETVDELTKALSGR